MVIFFRIGIPWVFITIKPFGIMFLDFFSPFASNIRKSKYLLDIHNSGHWDNVMWITKKKHTSIITHLKRLPRRWAKTKNSSCVARIADSGWTFSGSATTKEILESTFGWLRDAAKRKGSTNNGCAPRDRCPWPPRGLAVAALPRLQHRPGFNVVNWHKAP